MPRHKTQGCVSGPGAYEGKVGTGGEKERGWERRGGTGVNGNSKDYFMGWIGAVTVSLLRYNRPTEEERRMYS